METYFSEGLEFQGQSFALTLISLLWSAHGGGKVQVTPNVEVVLAATATEAPFGTDQLMMQITKVQFNLPQ